MIKVAAALIFKSNKFLLAKRVNGELNGKWEFPGGKIENLETEFEAIEREIFEELNLKIKAKSIIATFHHAYDFADIQLTLILCLLQNKKSVITCNGCHDKYAWVDMATELDLAPLDKKILDYLRKKEHLNYLD